MRLATALAMLLVAALLVGCGDGGDDAGAKSEAAGASQKKVAAAKAEAAAKVVPEKAAPPEKKLGSAAQSYVYDPEGKRDPFRSILLDLANNEKMDVPRAPLEQFELQQLALSAIIWETGRPRALVTDPGGKSFVIMKGSRIGKNLGRVVHIGDNLVLVKETYVDFAGEQSTKDVEMRIRRRQGG